MARSMHERRDAEQVRTLSRRTLVLGGVQTALVAGLAARLYYLQVIESEQYKVLSDENRISLRLIPPQRGRILDRNGVEIASTKRNYRAMIVPEKAEDVRASLDQLSKLVTIDDSVRHRVMREIQRKRKFMPVLVIENLSWEDFARINLESPELPGILVDIGETRDYPFGPLYSHICGYVGPVSEKELEAAEEEDGEIDPLLELPGFRIGKAGIEKVYDLDLRGRAGDLQIEVNAVGRVIRELQRHDGQPGEDMVLTIDDELQRFAAQRVREESAAVVVMDCRNGDVLAMVSNPGFDPNLFNQGISSADYKALQANKYRPLYNKVIQGQYPPGSTFKMVVGLAALEAGAITPETRVHCPGHMDFGGHTFNCWKKGGHGSMNYVSALEESCDVFFYETARRIGPDRIADMARRFGLGEATGIDLIGEKAGVAPTRAWKKQALKQPWYEGETLNCGIGQGYVLATPLQLAVMAARLGTNRAIKPRLVRNAHEEAPGITNVAALPPLVNPKLLDLAHLGMWSVTNGARGTLRSARMPAPWPPMSGKTGTAQVRIISAKEREKRNRSENDLPWELRHHGWFVAFVPSDNPRYACSVLIEHGGGASAAGPVVRDVLIEAMRLDSANRGMKLRTAGVKDTDSGNKGGAG